MATPTADSLEAIARSAIQMPGVVSAVICVPQPGTTALEIAAAAGVEGPARDGLAGAIRNPAHPIARTLAEGIASFNVAPTAPGGPPLRSHLPLLARQGDRSVAVGVLAVAHRQSLDPAEQAIVVELADRAVKCL